MRKSGRTHGHKKKQLLTICILLATLVLLGVLTLAYLYFKGNSNNENEEVESEELKTDNPEDVLTLYMSYINSKDYEKMYELLSSQSKLNIIKEDFLSRNQKIYQGIDAKNVTIQINGVYDSESGKFINYLTVMQTIAGELSFTNQITLKQNEDKSYGIEWNSRVIFPNLSDEDKIRVSSLKAERGNILDRNGTVLAGKGTVASVGLVPGKMSESIDDDIKRISEILMLSEDTVKEKLNASWVKPDSFVPIKSIAQTESEMKEKLLLVPGIMISDKEVRAYPLGEKAAHLTGYVQNINAEELKELEGKNYNENSIIGKVGLEKLLEDRIRGNDGYDVKIIDEDGNLKQTLIELPAQNGEDVKLTINADLQIKLYDQLKNDKSSTVVMNPKTGEVLALISTPAYDPNEFILGMSSERWQQLTEDTNKPMYNRFKAVLCPGSSFKPVTAAIGLTTGIIAHDENFGHSGLSWQNDTSWGNYKVTTLKDYGDQVNMRNAFIYSDNIYFAKAALKIGKTTFVDQLKKMGFDETLPFEFGLTSSKFGTDDIIDTEIQLADSGYGQGKILVNPVHMASIYSMFVNEGNMVKPYLEYKPNPTAEFWKEQIIPKEIANIISEDLIQVVENPNGTGYSAMIPGITIAGKTGTAEIKESKEDTTGTELGWFNAFLVDENSDRQYLAISMIEDVKGRGGSHYVIPIIKSVFED